MKIYKEFYFEAAHYLPSAAPGHKNASVHGHSFRARVTIQGVPGANTGLILHFDELQRAIDQARGELDHKMLNDIEDLPAPTLERIAQWLWRRLADKVPGLYEITIARDSCQEGCIYNGPAAGDTGA